MPPDPTLPRFLRFARALALVSGGTLPLVACASAVDPHSDVVSPPPGAEPYDASPHSVDAGISVAPDGFVTGVVDAAPQPADSGTVADAGSDAFIGGGPLVAPVFAHRADA